MKTGKNTFLVSSGSRAATVRMLEPDGLSEKIEPVRVTTYVNRDSTAARGYRLGLAPESGQKYRFLAVLTLHDRDGEGPAVSADGAAIGIRGDGWADTLAPGGNGGGIASDGHHAVIRRHASDIVRWCVFDAKRLALDGGELCTSSRPISAAWDASRRSFEYELSEPADVSVRVASRMVSFRGLAGRQELLCDRL